MLHEPSQAQARQGNSHSTTSIERANYTFSRSKPLTKNSTKTEAAGDCLVPTLCIAGSTLGVSDKLCNQWDNKPRIGERGQCLLNVGDEFNGLFVLRSGSAKSYVLSDSGEEQVTGFYFPGDLMGMDGFDNGEHRQGVKFLETSSLCVIDRATIDRLMASSSEFRSRILSRMSRALVKEQHMLLNLGKLSAEQRLAHFIVDISSNHAARGLSAQRFDLSMSRYDIANYLGLVVETVSRTLTKFQHNGVIHVRRRFVEITDMSRLQAIVAGEAISATKEHAAATRRIA